MKRIFIVLIFLAFYACSENKNTRLWDDDLLDPNNNSNPPAEINVLNPILDRQAMQADANDDSSWAGVGEIEIIGRNFASGSENNVVFFDDLFATVLEASPTRILIESPLYPKDTIRVRIAPRGAQEFEDFGNPDSSKYFKLKHAVKSIASLQDGEIIYGAAVGPDETVHIYIDGRVLKKVTKNEETLITNESMPFDRALTMKYGPDSALYCMVIAGRNKGIFRFNSSDGLPYGGAISRLVGFPSDATDFDFDQNKNFWAIGVSDLMYANADGSGSSVVFTAPAERLTSVRVYNNFVYFTGHTENDTAGIVLNKIWKAEISGNTVSAPIEVIDLLTTELANSIVNSITFSATGEMFMGITSEDPLVFNGIYTYRDGGLPTILFPNLIGPNIYRITWGNGNYLYATTQEGTRSRVLKVDLNEPGAPNYGRQ